MSVTQCPRCGQQSVAFDTRAGVFMCHMIDCRIWFKPEPEVLSPSWTHNTVYVVGSEEEHFICDRVYFDLEAAKAYCDEQDKRDYPKLRWSVMAAPIGGDWLQWEHVYPRAK